MKAILENKSDLNTWAVTKEEAALVRDMFRVISQEERTPFDNGAILAFAFLFGKIDILELDRASQILNGYLDGMKATFLWCLGFIDNEEFEKSRHAFKH